MTMRLFAFDVDQTILPTGLTVLPSKEQEALSSLILQGDAVAIASGRNFRGIKQYLDVLAPNNKYAISSNGSGVFNYEGKRIGEKTLPLSTLYHFYEEFKDKPGLVIYAYTDDDGIVQKGTHHYTEWEFNLNHMVKRFDLLKGEIPPSGTKLFKVMIASDSIDISNAVRFSEEDKKNYSIVRSDPLYLEVMPKGVDKSTGVEILREYLGIKKEDVYCFGDADNDLGMISRFNGVAMGNATEECKKVARFVTKECKDDGVYYALKNLLKAI
jgi:Cof subfamily protein (haloacid dehalogenase superfamily)